MPSSVLNSDDGVISGTSGIKAVGGDDGVLVFQSKGTETARINTDKQIVAAAGTASLPVLTTTGDVNTGIYFPAADNIGFATNGVIRGRWTTDGLCFGSDTAAANALDDYEEGTFTPNLIGSTSGEATYNVRDGTYTKIGRVVTVNLNISITSKGTMSGNVRINTLPFTVGDTLANTGIEASGVVCLFGNLSSAVSSVTLAAIANSTDCGFYRVLGTSATTNDVLTVAEIGTTFDFRASITYFT